MGLAEAANAKTTLKANGVDYIRDSVCFLQLESVAEGRESVVCISAHTGEGIPDLLEAIEENIKKDMALMHALIPFKRVGCLPTSHVSDLSGMHLPVCYQRLYSDCTMSQIRDTCALIAGHNYSLCIYVGSQSLSAWLQGGQSIYYSVHGHCIPISFVNAECRENCLPTCATQA